MKNILKNSGHALLALLVSGLGVALSPAVLGIVSPKAATALTMAGIAYQAFTGKSLQIAGTTDTTAAPAAAPAPVAAPAAAPVPSAPSA
jgi:hypothetical protein